MTVAIMEAIASDVALGMSEEYACALHQVCYKTWEKAKALLWLSRNPGRPVKSVKEPPAHFVFLQHNGHGLRLIERRISTPPALRVRRQCLL